MEGDHRGKHATKYLIHESVSSALQRHAGNSTSTTAQTPRTVTPIEQHVSEIATTRQRQTRIPAPRTPVSSTNHQRVRSYNLGTRNSNQSLEHGRSSFVASPGVSAAGDQYVFDKQLSNGPLPVVYDDDLLRGCDQSSTALRPGRLSFSELSNDASHTTDNGGISPLLLNNRTGSCEVEWPKHRTRTANDIKQHSCSPLVESSAINDYGASSRPYTSTLGVPPCLDLGTSPKYSVVSDAGDQAQLHNRIALDQENPFGEDIAQSIASLPPSLSRYSLQDMIRAARQDNICVDGRVQKFIPNEELYRVINAESVKREMMRDLSQVHPIDSIQAYAKKICKEVETNEVHRGKVKIRSYRKVFALLVLTETTPSIIHFLEEDVSDQDLPLKRNGDELFRTSDKESLEPLRCFDHDSWSGMKKESFHDYQYLFLAPYFSAPEQHGLVKHYLLQDEHILPFLAPSDANEAVDREGTYGKVIMVRIHPDHHKFRDKRLSERGFAIKKQIHENDRDTFKGEISILMKFSGDRSHKHVVSLLATYEQFRKFNLIFYRAEGNLHDLWKSRFPCKDYSTVLWVAEQFAGIADGLSNLHKLLSFDKPVVGSESHHADDQAKDSVRNPSSRDKKSVKIIDPPMESLGTHFTLHPDGVEERAASPIALGNDCDGFTPLGPRFQDQQNNKHYGRHGDINPANILWYKTDSNSDRSCGTLKIADFGQAELSSLQSKTKQKLVANTLTYRPPECDLEPSIIRQSYDIWCLACVYLEFIASLLGGNELCVKFARKRLSPDTFLFNQLTDTYYEVVRNEESQRIEFMVKPAVTEFIDRLHKHKHCTDYIHELLNMIELDMLVVESRQRVSRKELVIKLNEKLQRCKQDEGFATTPNVWSINERIPPRSVPLEMEPGAKDTIEKNLLSNVERPSETNSSTHGSSTGARMRRASRVLRSTSQQKSLDGEAVDNPGVRP